MQASDLILTCEETRPRLRRKTNTRDGAIMEKKNRQTESEMDGLCQPRHESYRDGRIGSP